MIGPGVAIVTAVLTVAGLLLVQIAAVNTRIGDGNARIDDMRADIRELRTDLVRFDERLRAVEIAFGKVDRRLLTIERIILPAPGE